MGPMQGIKVLDLTAMVSGPVATMMLADQGAEVVKVEPPTGEQVRHFGGLHNGVNAMFYSCNRGKRSIALDLKSEAGKAVLADLVGETDVLVQNFRPGAMERMGFGEARVRAMNEKIIYVSDQRLRRTRAVLPQARLRSRHPGAVRGHGHPGQPGNRQAGDVPHHHRRQGDFAHGRSGHRRGALPSRAHRRGPAHPAVDARIHARVLLARGHGRAHLRRARVRRDPWPGHDGPDLRGAGWLPHRRCDFRQRVDGHVPCARPGRPDRR